MLRKLIGERHLCGLDIGAQSLKAAVIKTRDGEDPGLLGVYETKTNGFSNASVTDLGELSECIYSVLSSLAKKTGIKVKEIELGISGNIIERRSSSAIIPLIDRGNKVIAQQDIRNVQTQANLLGVNMEETLLHNFPQFYKVDDINKALNPIGLFGRKLEISSLLVVANNTLIKNLTKAVYQAGYDVPNIYFSSFAASESALNDAVKRQGCALIDIGSTMTNIILFHSGQLSKYISVPIGGDNISAAIAGSLNLVFDLAEEIKKSYAYAVETPHSNEEEILIKREDRYLPVKKSAIYEAIQPVLDELLEAISRALKGSGMYEQINAGIHMVGGGSLLPGLPERIEKHTNLPVKLGKVNIATRRMSHAVKFTSAVGLAQMGGSRAFGYSSKSDGQASISSSLIHKVKELYHEYF